MATSRQRSLSRGRNPSRVSTSASTSIQQRKRSRSQSVITVTEQSGPRGVSRTRRVQVHFDYHGAQNTAKNAWQIVCDDAAYISRHVDEAVHFFPAICGAILLYGTLAMWIWLLYEEASIFGRQAVCDRLSRPICAKTGLCEVAANATTTSAFKLVSPAMAAVQDLEPLHISFPELFEVNFVTTYASAATNASKISDWLHREEYSDLVALRTSADEVKTAALELNSTMPLVQSILNDPDFGIIDSQEFQQAMTQDRENFKAFGATGIKVIRGFSNVWPYLFPATLEGRILLHLHNLTIHNNETTHATVKLLANTSRQINKFQTALLNFEDNLNNTKETTIVDMCKHSKAGDSPEHSVDCLAELREERYILAALKHVAQYTKGVFVVGKLEAETTRDALGELRRATEKAMRVPHLLERVDLRQIFDEADVISDVPPEVLHASLANGGRDKNDAGLVDNQL